MKNRPKRPHLLLWLLGLAAGGFSGYSVLLAALQTPPPAPQAPAGAPAAPAGAPAPDAGAPIGDAPNIVKITMQTIPPVKAEVILGKKRLGFINGPRNNTRKPFILERLRDSGPLDIVVLSEGYVPVNTRVYTFNDNKLNVKLTLVTEKHLLLGWKQALPDAGDDGGGVPDGGVPIGPLPPGPLPPPPVYGPPAPLPPPPALPR